MSDSKEKREVIFEKEDAYKSLQLINSWIGNIDTKASILLAYLSVIMGFVVSHGFPAVFSNETVAPIGFCYCVIVICIVALYLSLVLSVVVLLRTLTARIKSQCNKPSLLFFGDISKLSLSDYTAKIMNRTEEELIKDILEQTHTNAEICAQKSKFYNSGVKATLIATVLYIVCIIFKFL